MSERISGDPDRLEAYSEATQALIGPQRNSIDEYAAAIRALLTAEPNGFGTGDVADRSAALHTLVDGFEQLDSQPAAFAFALRELDRTGRDVLSTINVEMFDALVQARSEMPFAAPQDVVERADHYRAMRDLWNILNWRYYWPDLSNLLHPTSDEFGAVPLGIGSYLLEGYGSGVQLHLPSGVVHRPTVVTFTLTDGRTVTSRALLLDREFSLQTLGRGLRVDPVMPPKWATGAAKGVTALGVGLTIYGAGAKQWQRDEVERPEIGSGERLARAGGQAAVEGVPAAAGGLYLGMKGAAVGAAACSWSGPGALVCGGVGAVAGGFLGSKAGAWAGRQVKASVPKAVRWLNPFD